LQLTQYGYEGGSGANAPAYISDPFSAIAERAYQDDTSLFWDFQSGNPYVDTASDACLVFINAWATEGSDRAGLHGKNPYISTSSSTSF
jgi:beta-glucosidase